MSTTIRILVIASLTLLAGWLGCSPLPENAPGQPGAAEASFAGLSERFLDWYFAAHPVRATSLGIHDHDASLPDLSEQGRERLAAEWRGWLRDLETIDREGLTGDAWFDHRVLEYAIRAALLELEEVAGWRHDPMLYNRAISNGIASLIDRRFAPLETRLYDLLSRLDRIPEVTAAARANLTSVPPLWVELAQKSGRGAVRFLRDSVPAALDDQGLDQLDPELVARWERTHARALDQLERHVDWLELELMPLADGDYRLGPELFRKKLLYEEHIDLSVDELRDLNENAIVDYTAWVERVAARIDPRLSPAEVMRRLTRDHPTPERLIPTAREFVLQARDHVLEQQLLTLPSDALPTIRPTPPYARSGFASMSTPGPFELIATEAYYNITNVDPAWSDEQQQQHLTYFNYPGLLGVSVHEAMPGHFVQLLVRRDVPGDIRKLFTPSSLTEGWAHYTEQMMVDEGLGNGDPAVRLGQLRRALQRHARWYAALALHVDGESIDSASARFEQIAYFAPFPALRETRRATYNPTYLYYALGRMEIFRLRTDYQSYLTATGAPFSLHDFHDRLLRLGLPLPLAREALIPDRINGDIPH